MKRIFTLLLFILIAGSGAVAGDGKSNCVSKTLKFVFWPILPFSRYKNGARAGGPFVLIKANAGNHGPKIKDQSERDFLKDLTIDKPMVYADYHKMQPDFKPAAYFDFDIKGSWALAASQYKKDLDANNAWLKKPRVAYFKWTARHWLLANMIKYGADAALIVGVVALLKDPKRRAALKEWSIKTGQQTNPKMQKFGHDASNFLKAVGAECSKAGNAIVEGAKSAGEGAKSTGKKLAKEVRRYIDSRKIQARQTPQDGVK